MAPLSGKQQREYLKFQNKEAREASKMGLDEMRKQQLHEIKLQEAAAKANQGLGHKEQVNNAKLKDMGIPPPRMNKQKLGIPTQNPLAGTGMFKQGQRSLAQAPIFQAQGTDTVPAMLTPGEAVIPRAAAQDPKNKKAIKRMVQEGRRANMRDGAVDVRYSDAPGQAKYHADGTSGVPSLAYRHPDVPGSSFMHGTMSVPDFSRGSSAQANYNNGTYGVVPQQVQSAAGYQFGTVDADIDEERKRQNAVTTIIQPTIPVWDERYPVDQAEAFANAKAIERQPMTRSVVEAVPPVVTEKRVTLPENVIASVPAPNVTVVPAYSRADMVPQVNPQGVVATPAQVVPAMPASEFDIDSLIGGGSGTRPIVQTVEPVVNTSVVAPLAVAPEQMTVEQLAERDKGNIQNTPVAVAVPEVPPKVDPYANLEPTRRADYATEASKASRKIKSIEERVAELRGEKKTEKSFTDSLTNLFTASGFKEELGLNNQDIIRMAIATAVGAKRFGVNRALAYAGRQAFEESSKRNAQAQADERSIRSAAVQLHGQDLRDVRAREDAIALQKANEAREDFRFEVQRRDQAWKDLKDDAKAQEATILAYSKEFGDMAPYVPKDKKSEQFAITKLTLDEVNKARAEKNKQAEANAWTNGYLKLAQIADKTPKGTYVRNEAQSSVQQVSLKGPNGEIVAGTFNPKAKPGEMYASLDGRPFDMSKFTPYTTAKNIEDQTKDALKSSIPTHTKGTDGKPVKIDNHEQVVAGAWLAMDMLGVSGSDPRAYADLADQGYQVLKAGNKTITANNIAMAITASTIKLGADSNLKLIKGDNTSNKNAIRVATDQEQLRSAADIMAINETLNRMSKDKGGPKISMQLTMADIENDWKKFVQDDPKKANDFVKELPLNTTPAIAYYQKQIKEAKNKQKE